MNALRHRTFRWLALAVALAAIAALIVAYRDGNRGRHASAPPRPASTSSLLALTWAPSLCTAEPRASGCRSGLVGSRGATFLLHGLWPQPSSEQYCNVPQKGARPPVPLPDDVKSALQRTMSDSSVMAPHEWYAHGSCSGVTAGEYFRISLRLAEQATSVLDPLFAGARGEQISARTVRQAFDAGFGAGAGARVAVTCRSATLYEVRLSLPAVTDLRADGEPSLRDALSRGPVIPPGCGRATVP